MLAALHTLTEQVCKGLAHLKTAAMTVTVKIKYHDFVQVTRSKTFSKPQQAAHEVFLTGLAHLYNLIPYQRRALSAGKCGVGVEGGVLSTSDWMLSLQILTSGGYRCAPAPPNQ